MVYQTAAHIACADFSPQSVVLNIPATAMRPLVKERSARRPFLKSGMPSNLAHRALGPPDVTAERNLTDLFTTDRLLVPNADGRYGPLVAASDDRTPSHLNESLGRAWSRASHDSRRALEHQERFVAVALSCSGSRR